MDSAFLILVAIPLGIYVLVLLLNTRDLGEEEPHDKSAPLGQESGSVLDEPIAADAVPTLEPQRAEAILTDSEIIQDSPISSEVILAAEPVSARAVEPTDPQTDASDTTTGALAVADAALADEATRSPIATSEDVTQVLALPGAETTAVSSAAIEPGAAAPSEPGGESQPVTSSSQVQEPEPDSAAETTAETASQPIVAEELESSPAVPKPLPEPESLDEDDPILPEGPVVLPEKGSPKYAFDYRGRLWVEKKNKGFFRQLRRPQLPPEDPSNNSQR